MLLPNHSAVWNRSGEKQDHPNEFLDGADPDDSEQHAGVSKGAVAPVIGEKSAQQSLRRDFQSFQKQGMIPRPSPVQPWLV